MTSETYTELEKKTFNALIDNCMSDCEADISDLSSDTGLSIPTLKGVVGSLVKKGLAQVDEDFRNGKTYKSINAIVNGELLSFGCDEYSEVEAEAFKI